MNKALNVLNRIEKESEREFLPIIGIVKGKVLEDLVKKYKPRLTLEVGSLVGYSSILMARNLNQGKIISIEVNPRAAEIAKKNIEDAGFKDKVKVIVGNAIDILKEIKGNFDLVFLDANKEEYLDYLKLVEGKLSKNAVIVADNAKIFKDAMKEYLDYVRGSNKYNSKFYDFGDDGVEVSFRR